MKARRAVDPIAVGQRENGVIELCGALDQLFRVGGALQKGEGAAGAQLDVVGNRGGRSHSLTFVLFSLSVKIR